MSSIKLKHSGGNSVIIAAPSSNPAANRTITLNDTYGGDGSFVTANSSGNVGIGTTSPSQKLHVAGGNPVALIESTTSSGSFIQFENTSSSNTNRLGYAVHDFVVDTNGSERMRIKSNGNTDLQSAETAQGTAIFHLKKNSASGSVQSDMIAFDVGGSGRGKIVAASSGSGTPSFSTYSDRRLKTNIKDYISGYDKIKSIKVRSYDEVSNDDTKAVIGDTPATGVIGYIADEFQEVFPEGVRGTKDQVDSDGKPIYQSISDGLLTPHLVQALQSAIAKIEVLETKVAALEAG